MSAAVRRKGTHPPTLLRLVERAVTGECALRGERLLVAVSGGPDSMALLHALARLAARHRLELHACGVDHGLREAAAHELDLAAGFASQLGVPFARRALHVAQGGNLQARARAARREALLEQASTIGGAVICTAHHADDRAETVLLRLFGGAGPRGLAVLPPRDGAFARPLLRVRRADVTAHLARHDVPHAHDPSNLDLRFARARLRSDLLPALERFEPAAVRQLNALADALLAERPPSAELALPDGSVQPLGRAQRRAIDAARAAGRVELVLDVAGGRRIVLSLREEMPRVLRVLARGDAGPGAGG